MIADFYGILCFLQDIKSLISEPDCDIGGYLCDHLQKDIELLASVLGKSTEDAEIAVHMFLRHIMEGPTGIAFIKTHILFYLSRIS